LQDTPWTNVTRPAEPLLLSVARPVVPVYTSGMTVPSVIVWAKGACP
jgi:hypothetical protein